MASSSKIVGPASSNGEFTTHPRFSAGSQPRSSRLSCRRETNKSAPPQPPRPLLCKYNRWPSGENVGARSLPAELMLGPRFAGGPHESLRLSRWDT